MQDQDENLSRLQLDVIIEEIKSLNKSIWLLMYAAFFISLCFLKNLELVEPQKYVIGALFLLLLLTIILSAYSSSNVSNIDDDFRWLIQLIISLVISVVITVLINAVAYAFVWGYKYIGLTEKYHWYVDIFSSNWPK